MGAVADGDGALNQVSEGAVAGDAAGIVARASDGDRGDTISYSIDDAHFTIDGAGVVRVAAGATFDAEGEATVALTVTATSSDGSASATAMIVDVGDVNEYVIATVSDGDAQVNALFKDASNGEATGILAQAIEPDRDDTVSYCVDDARFTVDNVGVVRAAVGAVFDTETEPSVRECPIFCVTGVWSMPPEGSKDDDDFQGTAGRTFEGLRAA